MNIALLSQGLWSMIVALAQILLRSLRVNIHLLECPVVMDIAFMIDVSGSIPWQDIADVKEMMKKVTSRFLISSTETHVSLVSFSQQENMLHSFKDKQTITAIHNTIEHLTHPGGGTNMTAVFGEARDLFSNAKGGRSHVTRVLVLVSDGDYQKHERAVESSQRVKEEEIAIITIGVASPNTNEEVLQTIASSKEQFLLFPQVGSAARVDLSSDEIAEMICKAARKPEAIVLRVRENSALQGRIIISLLADSELMCALKCLNTVSCFSFNYKSNGQTCELNHANKLTSPFDLIWDLDSVYYEMVFTSGKQY
ncbi:unnamed protein product [Porites evermanni]|uniref:VWFA domain-containing protein n=1 Tax=Porites evermanni TaxID=104178 RepID=A0ABN8LWK7_9CNID|nr:unnamed protein product [Porites evermanni]